MTEKQIYQSELLANRLKKKYKELRKWARKNRITCYRLYDRDIPEIPVSIDLYEFLPNNIQNTIEVAQFLGEQNQNLTQNLPGIEAEIKTRTFVVLYLYERPYQKDDLEEEEWLGLMSSTTSKVLGIQEDHILIKRRKHQKGKDQYQKEDSLKSNILNEFSLCQECGQVFKIDLSSYLDTGLFFDHRPLRTLVRDISSKKSVLNLFCYTGSFSVYASQGNAKSVESVDLSNTYLDWAKNNMALNGFTDKTKYIFTRQDCIQFLQEKALAKKALINNPNDQEAKKLYKTYDLIILDPPTFSNSKNTNNVLDINKDWSQLVKDCLNILNPKGILYFSTNSERLKFDLSLLPPKTIDLLSFECKEITQETIPQDYTGRKPHRCWKFVVE